MYLNHMLEPWIYISMCWLLFLPIFPIFWIQCNWVFHPWVGYMMMLLKNLKGMICQDSSLTNKPIPNAPCMEYLRVHVQYVHRCTNRNICAVSEGFILQQKTYKNIWKHVETYGPSDHIRFVLQYIHTPSRNNTPNASKLAQRTFVLRICGLASRILASLASRNVT